MNQAIHFPDLEQWDDERQSMCFPALVSGMRVECQVSAGWLYNRFVSETNGATPLVIFHQHRLDVEDAIETLIAQGADLDGPFCLS
ncbi:hypothetical protein SGGMMB4_05362 [Sodalis glossinidius str. 'morsitans']|uniref:DUF1488 domain-containing protein n=1 Tax=Sodalis glossinidius (strain morsitans) TaxID=343509 RepID=Q2NQQ9_SODGM|nr:DUF1488 domain-containing protein [Sodalis glossinidius]BAE75516.1 conserved hypothetical protein [Sodalis glossinidius str. 'morsitans']CRL46588.1 hypothetical protein SGGMMB4_05362 [Sodalis glossinidius str. 'morsitans']